MGDCCSNNDNNQKEGEAKENSKPEFSEDEEMLIARMYKLVGPRWPLIAGRIPGRTAKEIEKYFSAKYASSTSNYQDGLRS